MPASQVDDKSAVFPRRDEKNLCEELKEEFDYVLIDCPAGIEQGFKNALAGADHAIVVTTPEVSPVRGRPTGFIGFIAKIMTSPPPC